MTQMTDDQFCAALETLGFKRIPKRNKYTMFEGAHPRTGKTVIMFAGRFGGDLLVNLVAHMPLDRDDDIKVHYTLLFRDTPTGKTAEIHFSSENEAMLCMAAWIAADEGNIGELERHRNYLREKLPKEFMP